MGKTIFLASFMLAMLLAVAFGQNPIDPAWQAAFDNVHSGVTMWPAWQVADGAITADGLLNDSAAWDTAERVYCSGEWFNYEGYILGVDSWRGFGDEIAEWRVLYDNNNMYLRCITYDDIHSEGDGTEPFWNVDAIELCIQPAAHDQGMFIQGGGNNPFPGHEYQLRFQRRFTETPGIAIYNGNGWTVCPATLATGGTGSYNPPCDEPTAAPNPAGIFCVAKAITSQSIKDNYDGAWCMECQMPFTVENFSAAWTNKGYTNPPTPGPTSIFKMDLNICDDDDPAVGMGTTGGQYSLRRYCEWWGAVDCHRNDNWSTPLFHHMWSYAGAKTNATVKAQMDAVYPDTANLYCGLQPWQYDCLIKNGGGDLTACGISILPDGRRINPSAMMAWNSPNPFKPYTVIHYSVAGPHADLTVKVYDLKGNLVRDLNASPTARSVKWDGSDARGAAAPSGLYIYKVKTGDKIFTAKMVLAR